MTDPKIIIAVTQAYLDGKPLQVRNRNRDHEVWLNFTPGERPSWNWQDCEYRVRPEPREIWVNIYPGGVEGWCTHDSKERADAARGYYGSTLDPVRFREVID